MKLHERHDITTRASLEINEFVMNACYRHRLTYAESSQILAMLIASLAKFEIRAERSNDPAHPA